MVWYSHLFQNFPQFAVIHTVKGFSESESYSIVYDSLQPQGLCSPWNSPGQNIRLGEGNGYPLQYFGLENSSVGGV